MPSTSTPESVKKPNLLKNCCSGWVFLTCRPYCRCCCCAVGMLWPFLCLCSQCYKDNILLLNVRRTIPVGSYHAPARPSLATKRKKILWNEGKKKISPKNKFCPYLPPSAVQHSTGSCLKATKSYIKKRNKEKERNKILLLKYALPFTYFWLALIRKYCDSLACTS